MNNIVKNPYVGPRTFQREDGDIFFGREREARDILALIASEQLVLFYAQSGAGKSSLLNTRIIPKLEDGEFEVLPVGRVQGDLPAGLRVENVLIYNLMNSILQQKTNPQALATLSLSEFLCKLDFNEGGYSFNAKRMTAINTELHWRRILIIDQFEEIFTTHLDAWVQRGGFFRQLAQALNDDPYLTIILTMRDDYIASLDLYAHLLPGGLRTRYYMQRLTKETALKAVTKPVETIRPFSAGVAEKLVEDLSGIVVYRPGGTQEIQSGQYVEPVQLQVVCYSLWENLSPEGTEVTAADLQEVGDVDQSLASFYNIRVTAVAKEKDISERTVREWFDKELITGNKTRNMVLQGKGSSAGLRNDVIQALHGDLVRTELRAGQIWIELSHDRLVEPVLASNAKWFEQNLSVFQRRVVLWVQQGHSESLLLGEKELAEAEKDASTLPLTKEEQEFLEESKKQIKRLQRDQNQRRMILIGLIFSVILLVAAIFFGISSNAAKQDANNKASIANTAQAVAINERNAASTAKVMADNANATAQVSESEAKNQAQKALAGSLAAQAESLKNNDHALALILSLEAYQRTTPTFLTRNTLFQLIQFTPYTRLFGLTGSVSSIAVSPDGNWFATANSNQIILIDSNTHQYLSTISGNDQSFGKVNSLAFNKEGTLLAAGGCATAGCALPGGQITLWDVTNKQKPVKLSGFGSTKDTGHKNPVKTVAFSPNGSILASGGFDQRIILWGISKPENPEMIGIPFPNGHTSFVNSLAFSPDGNILISGGDDKNIILWDVSQPTTVYKMRGPDEPHTAPINTIAFSPDGTQLASASDDNTVILWDWTSRSIKKINTLSGHTGYVRSLAFNSDGSILASAGFDNMIILWNGSTGEQIGQPLSLHTRAINTVAFGQTKKTNGDSLYFLLSGSDDHTITQWDLSTLQPVGQPIGNISPTEGPNGDMEATADGQQIKLTGRSEPLLGHTGNVNSLRFSPQKIEGKTILASASDDQTVILWDVSNPVTADVFLKLEGFGTPVTSAFFTDDGKYLITIEKNGRTTQWTIQPSDWLNLACKAVNRNLTQNEWDKYLQGRTYHKTCPFNP